MNDSTVTDIVTEHRSPRYDIAPLILNRWSARAMSGETIPEADFLPLFEAARWAASSRNNQPWRYRYATRTSDNWDAFFDLLSDGNQRWANRAALLVVVLSHTTYEGTAESIRNHSFETGGSWMALALEGIRRGFVVHPMQGFDEKAAREILHVPSELRVEIMTAIGVPGNRAELAERDRTREHPTQRKPLEEIVAPGSFEPT